MGLDPKYLESLPDSLVDMYGLVEMDILTDMARRISTYDYFIPAAQHQNQKLQELGMVQSEIIAKLSAITGQSQAEIVALLTEAGEQAIQDDLEYYTAAEVYAPDKVDTEALYEQLNAGLIQTEGAFKNLTRTIANTATKQFENALDRAWLQISTGAFDYTTAIKNAITDLSSLGLGAVKYPSGRVDSIEVAVRRAVVTGANQTASKTQEKLADQLEVELVEVTAHGGARPEHAKWQGKVFSRRGRVEIDGVVYEDLAKATGYGSGAGLCGWNCRHNFHPYIPGTARTWNDKQLKALEEKKIEYNGVKMTEYEASQVQRKIEREIRKQKRTISALEAAGEDASEYRSRLRNAQKSYTDFTNQTGMKKQSARTQIATGTGTATPAEKIGTNSQKTLENPGDRVKLNSRADPMADAFGAGTKSNPKEVAALRKEFARSGVELKEHEKEALGYCPGLRAGEPGTAYVSQGASYSAWLHEAQHMRDDKAAGWLGMRAIKDPDLRYEWEVRAYNVEIEMALKAGREDIAQKLRENLEAERRAIYGEYSD